MPRRRRSTGCWTGALCARTPSAPAQLMAPLCSPMNVVMVPCMDAGKPCTNPNMPWLVPGHACGACAPQAPRGDADAPMKRELLGCRQASSSSASTATQAALSTRPALEAALRPQLARAACASTPDLGREGREQTPEQRAPPGACCRVMPDAGAVPGCEGAHAQPEPREARNAGSCTCSPCRAPLLQRLLDVDQHGLLTLAQGYEALTAAIAARSAPPGVPCPVLDGHASTPVRVWLAVMAMRCFRFTHVEVSVVIRQPPSTGPFWPRHVRGHSGLADNMAVEFPFSSVQGWLHREVCAALRDSSEREVHILQRLTTDSMGIVCIQQGRQLSCTPCACSRRPRRWRAWPAAARRRA